MTRLRRCILIVGLVLLLPGATASAQELGEGWQAHTNVIPVRDLALEGDKALSKGYTWAATERGVVCYSASKQVKFATADGLVDDDAQAIAVDGGRRSRFGAYGSRLSVLHDGRVPSNVAEVYTEDFDPGSDFNATRQGIAVNQGADLGITKTDNPDPVVAGESLIYTLVITNSGPVMATGVIVTDTLPTGVSLQSATPSKGACGETGTITCSVDTLATSETATVTIFVTVDPSTRGTLANIAEVSADQSDPTPDNNVTEQGTAVNTEVDLAVTKRDNPDPVVAGETLTYALTVTNKGPSDATGVTVTDPLPSGVTLDLATPSQGTYDSEIGVWAVGSVADWDSATLTLVVTVVPSTRGKLTNVAEVSADQPDPTSGNNTATEETTVNAEADLGVTKRDDPDPVVAGEILTYTLIVTNKGPSDATGGTVTDTLPWGVTFDSATPSQGTYASATGVWMVGDLADGDSATLILVVTVDPSTRGTVANIAEVSAAERDPTLDNNVTGQGTTVNTEADLGVTKRDAPDPVVAGEPLTYTLTVANNGPSDATDVTVTDALPSGITLDLVTPSQGTYDGDTGVWAVGSVADGDSATLILVVTVAPSTRGELTNIAGVSADEPDPTPGNDTATEETTVNAEADLVVIKTDDPDPVIAGEILTYTLTVANNGPSDATGITVVDDLPEDVALASAAPSQGTCSGGDLVTCNIGPLASGANASVSLVVTVTSPLTNGTILTNVAAINGDETDPYPGNNSAQAQTTVQSSPVLTIAKVDDPDPVDAGHALRYTLVVTNSGNENATSVTVTEHYDPNSSFFCSFPDADSGSGNRVWTLPTVAVGDPGTIGVIVMVTSSLPSGTVLANYATLDSDQTAPVAVTEFTDVNTAPGLTLSIVDVLDPVEAGGTLVYVITYQNFGTAPATGLIITATYDSQVDFKDAGPFPDVGNNVWHLDDLPVSQGRHITVAVDVDTPLANGTVLTCRVTIDSDHTSPQTFPETTRVSSAPDLAFSVTDHPDPVDADTPLTYTLRYTNTGNADATGVVITATLDSFISFAGSDPQPEPTPGGSSDQVRSWNVGTIPGEGGFGKIIIHANVPFSLTDGTILTFTAQLEDAEGDFPERTAQTTVRSLPNLYIEKVGEGHEPGLFSPGGQMAYILTYGNAGYGDAEDVIITTTLPTGTTYVDLGYGWQPSGDEIYTHAVYSLPARSMGHTITFTVAHTGTPAISAPEFNTPFTIAAHAGAGDELNLDDNTTSVYVGVPDLLINDLSVEPGPASVQTNVPVTFTFTITLMNQGTGTACDPDGMGSFFVDVFTAPVVSYPYQCSGVISKPCNPIGADCQPDPLIITQVINPSGHSPVFYVKVDNHCSHLYGLVPEFNEMNNVAVWPPRVLLPIVLRNYRTWDTYYEENDNCPTAYGPLAPGQTYLAYPDDTNDYYFLELSTPVTVSVSVEDFAPTSSYGDLLLYGPASGDDCGNLKAQFGKPGHSSMSVGPHLLDAGKYFVRVYTASGHYSETQLYRLTVTY